ncbi:MAG: ribosomal RNA small subunit methyltransferase A [Acidobacteria bacterium RBG_16_68_9]|nr:MAG: ribosomal RNA small subunit methyltransferase A [Acidobacteria bacterium RBG_16_68_9]
MIPRSSPRPRKRFGQHFLVQAGVAERIVAQADLTGREGVLEIGPGHGALTALLVRAAVELWLIEIDRDLNRSLREQFASDDRVHVIEGDVLRIDLPGLLGPRIPVTVVANLPYNVATPVVMRLLDTPECFARLVLMLQREVAARLSAVPGTRTYGALSVMAQLAGTIRTAFSVGPGAFVPRPKVESSVVVIEPLRPPRYSANERNAVRRIVRTAFAQRRKQLGNALAILHPHVSGVLRRVGIDPRRRAETLSPEDFVRLTQALRQDQLGLPSR